MLTGAHPEQILTFEQASQVVFDRAQQILRARGRAHTHESTPLLAGLGRILAEPIAADRDLPPFPRATRDGFAVHASDVANATENRPANLKVVAEIAAGAGLALPKLDLGETAEIMTGAPVPSGADAVVMVEFTQRSGNRVAIQREVRSGDNVVPRGAEAKSGQKLFAPGWRIDHVALAVAASVGKTELKVYPKPQVAILATGDELVAVGERPGAHQIRNSNSISLAAQVLAVGGEPLQLPIARDEAGALRKLVEQGLKADLLLLSGGVSMGKHDLVEQVLRELGAEFFFTGALIQPGRPIVFGQAQTGKRDPVYFFGLPGNPVSTMVTFKLFVQPILEALSGAPPSPLHFVQVKLKAEIKTKTGLTRFLPARLSGEHEGTELELVRWQGSGDVVATASANCYAVIPPDRDRIEAGEMIAVLLP